MENLKKHLFPSSRPAGGADSRSVFHIDNSNNDRINKEVQECFESVEEFKNAVKNLDGAGTHLTECLTQALKETGHQSVGEECGGVFREVYACEQTAIVSQHLQDMSAALLNMKAKMEEAATDDVSSEYSQTLCKVLLVFLKTQQAYHRFCSDKLSELVRRLNTSKEIANENMLTDRYMSMVLSNMDKALSKEISVKINNSPSQSPKGSPKTKKAEKSQGSSKTIRSSFLSIFDRKPSPEEGKSAFYVDTGSDAAGCSNRNEQDSTQNAGSSQLETRDRDQAGAQSEQSSSLKEVPQANLLGLDLDGSAQSQPRLDNMGQVLPKLTLSGHGHISNVNSQGHPPSAILRSHLAVGQGHLQSATGQGQLLVDFIGHPEAFDPKMAAGSHSKPFPKGLDTAHPSSVNHMVDPWTLQAPPGLPPPNIPKGMVHLNGQLASEEELESVINLLSGVNCSNSPMQAIPENQVQGPVQLTVPQIYRMPSPASDSHVEEMKHPKYQMHRRSEGCLDLSGVRGNTWPHQHRASLPAVQSYPHRQMMEAPPREVAMFMRRYSQDMHMPYRPSPAYGVQGHGHVMPGSQWPYQGSGTWPTMQNPGGSDTMNSSWSGVQDSSDLSDDSSSGEQFYAVGRDLVQAIHTKEDSSDDECEKHRGTHDYQAMAAPYDTYEKSSMHTWPPKQQWSQSNLYLNSGVDQLEPTDSQFQHRPVQMQWSDPMSSRSMWPAGPPPLGIPQQRTSQSMQGFGTLQ